MSSLSTQKCLSCHKDLPSGVSVCPACAETQAVDDKVSSELSAASKCQNSDLDTANRVERGDSGDVMALDAMEFMCLDDDIAIANGDENSDMPAPPVSAADNTDSQDVSLDFIALDEEDEDESDLPDVPPPAPSASDAQDMSMDCVAMDDSSCLPDAPPPPPGADVLSSASDAQDMSMDCVAMDDSSCLPDVPPPPPDADVLSSDTDVPPPPPGANVLSSDADVPPPPPGADVLSSDADVPPPPPGADVLSSDADVPPAPGAEMAQSADSDKVSPKSSVSFAVQAEALPTSENVQTFEMNQETPDTNGQFYLNSDISVIPEVSETTRISAEFALADTGVGPVPDASVDLDDEEDCDKTAAYDRPAFLDAFVSANEPKESIQPASDVLSESDRACADLDVSKSDHSDKSEPSTSDKESESHALDKAEDVDDTMIAPSRPVQQDTSAGLKAVPLRTLSQLSFSQSFAVSSSLQAQKQGSPALLENVNNAPNSKSEPKSEISDVKIDHVLDSKTTEALETKGEAANDQTVAHQAKTTVSQSHENNKVKPRSAEARKVSPKDHIVEAPAEPETQISEAKTFSLGQVVTIIVLFLVIIFLILFLIYLHVMKSPIIGYM